jgi:hypothetical protein
MFTVGDMVHDISPQHINMPDITAFYTEMIREGYSFKLSFCKMGKLCGRATG